MENLILSPAPHIHTKDSSRRIMLDVIIALLPAAVASVVIFGVKALPVLAACVIGAVVSECLFNLVTGRKQTVGDLSAVVTGLLLALNLSTNVPVWQCVIGAAFAVVIVKCLFGGLGHNIMNPALAARCFLLISFAAAMTSFPETCRVLFGTAAQSGSTPLAAIRTGASIDWFDMIFNTHTGCIGEASAVAVLLGAVYLLVRRVITIRIPGVYILSTVGFICLLHLIRGTADTLTLNYLVAQVCGGGLLLGAFYMANDYVTCPITPLGQLVYALLLGLLTALFLSLIHI